MTDNLHIRSAITTFNYNGSHILIDVQSKNCLNDENVIVALLYLQNAQIVHIAITIEVQVGQHVL